MSGSALPFRVFLPLPSHKRDAWHKRMAAEGWCLHNIQRAWNSTYDRCFLPLPQRPYGMRTVFRVFEFACEDDAALFILFHDATCSPSYRGAP